MDRLKSGSYYHIQAMSSCNEIGQNRSFWTQSLLFVYVFAINKWWCFVISSYGFPLGITLFIKYVLYLLQFDGPNYFFLEIFIEVNSNQTGLEFHTECCTRYDEKHNNVHRHFLAPLQYLRKTSPCLPDQLCHSSQQLQMQSSFTFNITTQHRVSICTNTANILAK